MKHKLRTHITLIAGLMATAAPVFADFGKGLETTITELTDGGKVSLDVRARYEYTDVNPSGNRTATGLPTGGTGDLNGYSLRTRLGFTTAQYHGLQAMVEMEHLAFVDEEEGNFLDAAAAENRATELNQLWLSYSYENYGSAKLGRQIFTLDDHRFIGHVGWRQNIQTYDAFTVTAKPLAGLEATLGYLSKVHRVNGTSLDMDTYLVNASWKADEWLKVTGFGYVIESKKGNGGVIPSSSTVGIRATGKVSISDDFYLNYAGSYARQTDNDQSKYNVAGRQDFENAYYTFSLDTVFHGFTLGAAVEVLEGNGKMGFSTPLATVHKFQGFADVFAGPSISGALTQGLVDYSLSAGYTVPVGNGIPITATWHWFEAERIDAYLGQEIDLTVGYKLNSYLSFLLKVAYYGGEVGNAAGYGGVDKTVVAFDTTFKF